MRTLTLEQWRVLTYIQQYTRKWYTSPKLGDIRSGCLLPSGQYAIKLLHELSDYGLLQVRAQRKNGHTIWSARVLPSKQTIGVIP